MGRGKLSPFELTHAQVGHTLLPTPYFLRSRAPRNGAAKISESTFDEAAVFGRLAQYMDRGVCRLNRVEELRSTRRMDSNRDRSITRKRSSRAAVSDSSSGKTDDVAHSMLDMRRFTASDVFKRADPTRVARQSSGHRGRRIGVLVFTTFIMHFRSWFVGMSILSADAVKSQASSIASSSRTAPGNSSTRHPFTFAPSSPPPPP